MGRVIKVNFGSKTGYELGEVISVGDKRNNNLGYIYHLSDDGTIHIALPNNNYIPVTTKNISKIHKTELAYFIDNFKDKLDPIYDYLFSYYKEMK